MRDGEEVSIGDISNYYGGLSLKKDNNKYYWSIEDYDGHYWEEIPESLANELILFEKSRAEG